MISSPYIDYSGYLQQDLELFYKVSFLSFVSCLFAQYQQNMDEPEFTIKNVGEPNVGSGLETELDVQYGFSIARQAEEWVWIDKGWMHKVLFVCLFLFFFCSFFRSFFLSEIRSLDRVLTEYIFL